MTLCQLIVESLGTHCGHVQQQWPEGDLRQVFNYSNSSSMTSSHAHILSSRACIHMCTNAQTNLNRWEHCLLETLLTHNRGWGKSKSGQQSLTRVKEERQRENKRMSAEWEAERGWRGRVVGCKKKEGWYDKSRAGLLLNFFGVFRKTKHIK